MSQNYQGNHDAKRVKQKTKAQANGRKKKSTKSKGLIIFSKIWALLYLAACVLFIIYIAYTSILPRKFLLIAAGVLGGVSLLLFITLFVKAFKKSRKIFSIILTTALMAGFAFVFFDLGVTMDFFTQVTNLGTQWEKYYVVTTTESNYLTLNDIKGETVETLDGMDSNYSAAQKKLKKKVDVTYKVDVKVSSIGEDLLDGKTDTALVSAAHYDAIRDSEKTFKNKTRIIQTINVRVSSSDLSKNVNVTKKSYNIYLSGLDIRGSIDQTSRSDVNMIITVNPVTHTVILTSIPRDYLVHLKDKGDAQDKLTHTGIYGIRETLRSVEDLTGLDMNYFVKVNYSTLTRFIDAIGGIDVYSDYAFVTHGQAYYEFKKGKNHLNGKEALAFARERKAFTNGDVQRTIDQEKVMEAILKKATSSRTILMNYNDILDSCKQYMQINMTSSEIRSIIRMQLSGGYKWKIYKQHLNGTDSSQQCYSSGDYYVYVMEPIQESVDQGVWNIRRVMNGKKITKKDASRTGSITAGETVGSASEAESSEDSGTGTGSAQDTQN